MKSGGYEYSRSTDKARKGGRLFKLIIGCCASLYVCTTLNILDDCMSSFSCLHSFQQASLHCLLPLFLTFRTRLCWLQDREREREREREVAGFYRFLEVAIVL